jgi:hypothetical protein
MGGGGSVEGERIWEVEFSVRVQRVIRSWSFLVCIMYY